MEQSLQKGWGERGEAESVEEDAVKGGEWIERKMRKGCSGVRARDVEVAVERTKQSVWKGCSGGSAKDKVKDVQGIKWSVCNG